MSQQNIIQIIQKSLWIGVIIIATSLIICAARKKASSKTKDLLLTIIPIYEGNNLLDRKDVETAIDRAFGYNLTGLPIEEIDVSRVERVLKKEPFIKDAEVFIDAKNNVNITLKQRQPVLRVIDVEDFNYYFDKEGHKMPLSVHFTARVPVATGHIPIYEPDFLERKKHRLKDLFLLTKYIRNDVFLNALVEQIYVDEKDGFILIPKIGRQKIIIGAFEDMDTKKDKLKLYYKEGMPYSGWQKYRTINLTYKDQVVCKRK